MRNHERKSTPESPLRLPVKLHPVSNGEIEPKASPPAVLRAQAAAHREAADNARRQGVDRRRFLASACGTATTLVAMNRALAGPGAGGWFDLPPEAVVDEEAAREKLNGDELIIDVQTHHVDTEREWDPHNDTFDFLKRTPQGRCGEDDSIDCYSTDRYIREVFLNSDTDVAVLSMLAGTEKGMPLTTDEGAETRERVARAGAGRLLIHAAVLPNRGPLKEELAKMEHDAGTYGPAAWKLYPLWGPDGEGYWLDDEETGLPVVEHALKLGISRICVHKGIPLRGSDVEHTRCRDIGPVARQFPALKLIVYHSGFDDSVTEGPYRAGIYGVDGLVKSLRDSGIEPNANVWAELGTTWREVMRKPTEAAHVLGKLLKYVGEDRVLWGTDAIWYGSPQDQIEAFRAFQISAELQEKHGYPALTPKIKAKLLGLNAAKAYDLDPKKLRTGLRDDPVDRARDEWRQTARRTHTTYGPRTRRELFALWRSRGGLPG